MWCSCMCTNFTVIGMYKEKVCGMLCAPSFIHVNCFVRMQLSSSVDTLCFSMNSKKGFIHEQVDSSLHVDRVR